VTDAIIAQNVGKRFRRYHADRPATLHETLLRGFGKLKPADGFWGLRDVSFRVAPGRTVGVIGRNGAGKSTLLRLLGGVGRPDEGTVQLRGRVGALLTLGAGFHPELTGRENLFIAAVVAGLTRREVRSRLDSIVAFSELEGYLEMPLRAYSTGMQMRLAFSIAIHSEPDILLIDEVLAVGDLAFQRKCLQRITDLKARGCAIVFVSHEPGIVQELCDECLWLSKGAVAAHGPADEVVQHYVEEVGAAQGQQTFHEESQRALAPSGAAGRKIVEISGVRVLDAMGRPATTIDSGSALTLEIGYRALRPTALLNFQVQLYRDDGLHCFDVCTQSSITSLADVFGEGSMRLHLDQLDLNSGLYYLDVCAFEHDGLSSYDSRGRIAAFRVRRTQTNFGILRPPHRWEVAPGSAQPEASAAARVAG
jgi:lipopolysaccharide transport system ATP-binding protein